MLSFNSVSSRVLQTLNSTFNFTATRHACKITSIHAITSMKTQPNQVNHSVELGNRRKCLLDRPGLFGIKRGMITWFNDNGRQFPATVIEIDSVEVIKHKTEQEFGYTSVMVGAVDKLKNVNNLKLFEQAGVSPKHKLGEFRVRSETGLVPVGAELKADMFAVGQMVDIKGITKGKGFAGVMKRHGFKGLAATHGVSKAHRKQGATGGNQDPGRVLPGKKMAGRMGGRSSTEMNLEVLHADGDAGILVVKGCIPGPNKAYVKITDSVKLYGKSIESIERD
ncbi:uncharacterized protein SPAPADRAFT_59991 [Spathaspora passalidarum NRRL Y-27907]|uniref:Large ribosomal subunit protein uL3m n=1 Tax=Spathaspora passalidarum (strain NRRL Y-27907 / 11-Y1) TaxID=619300 RepID=G3AJA4_SPAPN|nr:uncharacterized protein SPAPADRAFT_59991 [Spathaspora passalidarum NRRL Y-27907]EGW34563.1 hypothetical protein SPAPADRAFT_59991 [Spathaspora passalidarum NRRL Y-27907]